MGNGIDKELFVAVVSTPDGDIGYQAHSRDKAIEAVRRAVEGKPCARQIRVWRYKLDGNAGRAVAKPRGR